MWNGERQGEKYLPCVVELESGGCHGDWEVRKEKGCAGIDTHMD